MKHTSLLRNHLDAAPRTDRPDASLADLGLGVRGAFDRKLSTQINRS